MVAASQALEIANKTTPPPSFTFVSSDLQFLRIMQHEKYTVKNPEDYP
jgi:hypothetical protein